MPDEYRRGDMPGVSIGQSRVAPSTLRSRPSAAAQLRSWVESETGQHLWHIAGPLPSLDRICHALDTTHAMIYGLIIAPDFFTICSTFQQQTFTRLADRYQSACQNSLCFWWDGSTLHYCEPSSSFFALLQTLPPPSGPSSFLAFRGRRP
jgi:hypothetical protein